MKLSPSEIIKFKEFIKSYSDLHQKFTIQEEKINSLDEEKTKVIEETKKLADELELLRESEIDFQKTIQAKYGNVEVNVETFELRHT
jgi:predicted  nucleic acid-binding Zn-ribbon protein